MTLEAVAGKNPVSHVGKLYNLAAMRIAGAIATGVPGVEDASCLLVSQIGRPVDNPQVVDIILIGRTAPGAVERPMREIVNVALQQLLTMRDELLAERVSVY